MTSQSSSSWATGRLCRSGPFPRRSLEIGAIVVGFIYWCPIGLALVAWKFAGYPAFAEMRDAARRTVSGFEGGRPASRFARAFEAANRRGGSGNAAFDEYRRAELDRLDAPRRAHEEDRRALSDLEVQL